MLTHHPSSTIIRPCMIVLLLFYIAVFCQNAQALQIKESIEPSCPSTSSCTTRASNLRSADAREAFFLFGLPFEISLYLASDKDHNGFYGGFALEFQPLAGRRTWDYFADVYLQSSDGNNRLLFTTRIIPAPYSPSIDHYRAELLLENQIVSDWYRVLIDFYDARNHVLIGSTESTFGDLTQSWPLEAEHQQQPEVSFGVGTNIGSSGFVAASGAISGLPLLLICLFALGKRFRA